MQAPEDALFWELCENSVHVPLPLLIRAQSRADPGAVAADSSRQRDCCWGYGCVCCGQTGDNICVLTVPAHVDNAETHVPTVHPFHD